MKIFVLAILLSITFLCQAQEWFKTGSMSKIKSCEPTESSLIISETSKGLHIVQKIPYIGIDDSQDSSTHTEIIIKDFESSPCPGQINLPSRILKFEVPQGMELNIGIPNVVMSEDFPRQLDLPLVAPDKFESCDSPSRDINPGAHAYYTSAGITKGNTYEYRGLTISEVIISPCSYNTVSGTLTVAKEISFDVEFVTNANKSPAFEESDTSLDIFEDDPFLSDVISPYSADYEPYGKNRIIGRQEGEIKKRILILTSTELTPAAEKLSEWKRKEGYNTDIQNAQYLYSEKIKRTISNFASSHSDLYAIIIIGSPDHVSSCEIEGNEWVKKSLGGLGRYLSDTPYGCLGGDADYIPDILLGRLPARNLNEAMAMVNKIIDYGICQGIPLSADCPINRVLHVGYFQPADFIKGNDGYYREGRRFITTCERILNSMRNAGYEVTRCYSNGDSGEPRYFYDGSPLPPEITYGYFNWRGDKTDIKKAWDGGLGYILYRGHGILDSWDIPNYTSIDVSNLRTSAFCPIIFSMTCLTGDMSRECLASRFLNEYNQGASAVIAASNLSLTTRNDVLSFALLHSIYPSAHVINSADILPASPILGECLQYSMRKMYSYFSGPSELEDNNFQSLIYHIYGDPTQRIHLTPPQRIRNVSASVVLDEVTVSVPSGNVNISAVYESGDVKAFHNKVAKFPNYKDISEITITGDGILPFSVLSDTSMDTFSEEGYIERTISTSVGLKIFYHLPTGQKGILTLTDLTGNHISRASCNYQQGSVMIPTLNTPRGVYILTLSSHTEIYDSIRAYPTKNVNSGAVDF